MVTLIGGNALVARQSSETDVYNIETMVFVKLVNNSSGSLTWRRPEMGARKLERVKG